jgi:sodium-dependent phosphate cotransporter
MKEDTSAPATPVDVVELPDDATPRRRRGLTIALRIGQFVLALFLFVLAIQMMKEGAGTLSLHLELAGWNAISTLGLGALLAYLFLSGKPVAAFALALFAAGGLTRLQAFTMLSGGRLGAAFIVLLVGFLYAIRGRNARESIGVGVLALSLTALVYVPGMMVGYGVLKSGLLDSVDLTSARFQSVIGYVFDPIVHGVANVLDVIHVPDAVLLPIGGAVIVGAIKLLDRLLPEVEGRRLESGRSRVRSQWVMFLMGFLITLVTLSVSVALTILVPLAAKGHVTRKEAIPYIMGANVATLADTLLVAVVYNNAVGVQIVLAEFIGVALVTAAYLVLAYRPLCRGMLALDEWVVARNSRLWAFVATLFVLPALLLAAGFAFPASS